MLKRPPVLVAIDHATDMERTIDVAVSTAKANEANVHVIRVAPHGATRGADRTSRGVRASGRFGVTSERLASVLRSAGHDGVCVRNVTVRGNLNVPFRVCRAQPGQGTGGRGRLWQLTVLAKRRSGRRSGAPVARTAPRIAKPTGG